MENSSNQFLGEERIGVLMRKQIRGRFSDWLDTNQRTVP